MTKAYSKALSSELSSLTDIQSAAVNWDEGPLILLAGPGSGKTRVLTCRISRLLQSTPDAAFRILALTFTNHAADEMRARIELHGAETSRRLFVGTFHSFCAEVLRQDGAILGFGSNFRIYSQEQDRRELLKGAMREALTEEERQEAAAINMLPLIDRLKGRMIDPSGATGLFKDQRRGEIVSKVYASYERILRSSNTLDFESLTYYTTCLFRDYPALAKRYRTTYKYWCIDEFQDSNSVQYQLIKTMAGGQFNNIFVVADDDQIIYQWNGASYKRLEQFSEDFRPDLMQLPTNFRCPGEVVALANNLVKHNALRTKDKKALIAIKATVAESDLKGVVRLMKFPDEKTEAAGIARLVSEEHSTIGGSHTILARTRALLEGVQEEFRALGVKARIAQRRDNFQSLPFIWLHSCLRQSHNRRDTGAFEAVVGAFNEMASLNLAIPELMADAESSNGDLLGAWVKAVSALKDHAPAKRIAKHVDEMLVQSTDYRTFCDVILDALNAYVVDAKNKDAALFSKFTEDKEAWTSLWRDIHASIGWKANLETFLQELELRSKEAPLDSREINLMTIHGSKGKEFDHVYVIGLAEDILPSFQSKQKGPTSAELEEERRNCFVAITRTKETLVLSYAAKYRGWDKTPSRFLSEMGLEI